MSKYFTFSYLGEEYKLLQNDYPNPNKYIYKKTKTYVENYYATDPEYKGAEILCFKHYPYYDNITTVVLYSIDNYYWADEFRIVPKYTARGERYDGMNDNPVMEDYPNTTDLGNNIHTAYYKFLEMFASSHIDIKCIHENNLVAACCRYNDNSLPCNFSTVFIEIGEGYLCSFEFSNGIWCKSVEQYKILFIEFFNLAKVINSYYCSIEEAEDPDCYGNVDW